MPKFEDALRIINKMRDEGVIADYAVAGAMALVFWSEPIPTYDLDVLVFLPTRTGGPIVSLRPIYEWTDKRGYPAEKEHVKIEGIPVQFLPAHNQLADEAIETAVQKYYGDVPIRVVRPEYLIALFLEGSAKTPQRRERAAALQQSEVIDQTLLQDVMMRFKLKF